MFHNAAEMLQNQGKTRIFKELSEHDKSIICLPWEEFLFCLNLLILCGFSHNRRVHYNDFTTSEKCSDMTKWEIAQITVYLPIFLYS